MRYFERLRLDFIKERLETIGFIRRADLVEKFEISLPQAANDFAKYKILRKKWKMPEMAYNTKSKRYEVVS